MQQEREAVARIAEGHKKPVDMVEPVAFESLANLTLGAANVYGSVSASQSGSGSTRSSSRGLAQDVAALVEKIERDSVDAPPSSIRVPRRAPAIVQMVTYGSIRRFTYVWRSDHHRSCANLKSACAGAGEQVVIATKRLANDPTFGFRGAVVAIPISKAAARTVKLYFFARIPSI